MERADFFVGTGRGEALTLSLDGWEGPLDLLLTLARSQKVDLREISILALVEQYLAYLESAKSLQLQSNQSWGDICVMGNTVYCSGQLTLPKFIVWIQSQLRYGVAHHVEHIGQISCLTLRQLAILHGGICPGGVFVQHIPVLHLCCFNVPPLVSRIF